MKHILKKYVTVLVGIGLVSAVGSLVLQRQFASVSFFQFAPATVQAQPDVTVTTLVPSTIGNSFSDPFLFSFRVINTTAVPLENVVIKDVIPAGLTIVLAQAGCTVNGNEVTCSIGTLSAYGSRNFLVRLSAPANTLCGQTLTNTVSVTTSTTEANTNNNQVTAQTRFTCLGGNSGTSSAANSAASANSSANSAASANSSTTTNITPTDVAMTIVAPVTLDNATGNEWLYRINVMNMTAIAAQKVLVLFTVPSTVSIPTVPTGCMKVGTDISCTLERLDAFASTTFVIGAASTARSLCDSKIQPTAMVTTETTEINKENNQASALTTFTCSQSNSSAYSSANSVASSSASTGSPRLDITLTKSAPATVANDFASMFNYIIAVSNTTEVAAQNVVVRDVVPSNLQLGSIPSGCTKNGNEVTCTVSTMNAYSSKTFIIGVSIAAKSMCGQSVTNTVQVSTDTVETNVNNNQASASTSFTCSSPKTELTLVAPSPGNLLNNSFPAGFNYDITVKNESLVNADNVVVTTVIPAPFTVKILPPNCTSNGNTVTCTMPPLRWYSDYKVTLPVITPARTVCDQTVTFSASVSTSTPEINAGNNQSSFSVSFMCLLPETSLAIAVTAPTEMDNATNSTIEYNVTVTNTSEVAAYNVVVDHKILRYVPYTGSNVYRALFPLPPYTVGMLPTGCVQMKFPSNDRVQCSFFVLEPNQSKSYVIRISAPERSVCRDRTTLVTNVTTSTTVKGHKPIGTANLTIFQCTEVQTESTDLKITHTAPATVANDVRAPLNYTITVHNPTASPISNIVVTDTIPTSMEIVTAEGCTKQGQNLTCAVGTLAPNATRTFTINVAAPARMFCGQLVTNVATISSASPDLNPNDNQASADVTFTCSAASTDLSLSQSAPSTISNDNVSTFNYIINGKNNTEVAARDVVIVDTIPSAFTITYLPTNCTRNGNAVRCTASIVPGNSPVGVTIGVTAPARSLCGQTVTNSATISTSTTDTNVANNQASASIVFTCSNNSSSSSSSVANQGSVSIVTLAPATMQNDNTTTFSYVVTVKNTTVASISNIKVVDTLPSVFSITSVPSGCTQSYNTLTCSIGTLAAGASRSITIPVSVINRTVCSQSITNTATVTVNNANPLQASAQTSFTCDTTLKTDIGVSNTSPSSLNNTKAATLSFLMRVANWSALDAQNVNLSLTLPANVMQYISAPAGCVKNSANENQSLLCSLGTITRNSFRSITLSALIPANTYCNSVIVGLITTTTSTQDSNQSNNFVNSRTNVTCAQ